MQIVIARAEKTKLVPTGRTVTRDMNYFPEFAADWEGKAAMWVRDGKEPYDVLNAKHYAEQNGYFVLCFDKAERDPLGKARAEAVKRAKTAESGN